MISEEIQIQLDEGAISPLRATSGSAGYDLSIPESEYMDFVVTQNEAFNDAIIGSDEVLMPPGSAVFVNLGFRLYMPEGLEGQIRARSGLGNKGLVITQGVGTIDSDYRGYVKVGLHNIGNDTIKLEPRMRIAQLVFAGYHRNRARPLGLQEVDRLPTTDRGDGGFGSTGS